MDDKTKPGDGLDEVRAQLLAAGVSPDLVPLVHTMTAQGVPVASQHAVIRGIYGVRQESIANPYQMSRVALGMSPAEADRVLRPRCTSPSPGTYAAMSRRVMACPTASPSSVEARPGRLEALLEVVVLDAAA